MATSTSDAQSAIDILKADNERLNGEIAKLTSARDKHKSDHDIAAKELAELRKQQGDPEAHKKRADELEHKLRVLSHQREFDRIAKAAGAKEKALDALWKISAYEPAKDEIDADALEKLVTSLKETADYAFEAPAAGGQTTPPPPATKPVPGAGRGGAHQPSQSGITLTRAQMADPKFMLDPANKEVIQEAAKAHRFSA